MAFAIKLEHPTVRRGSLDPIALQPIFGGWYRRVPHGIKIATFRDDGEVEEAFTSTTVRTRDTVFPLFGDAGTQPATEAELQEFGESVRARPRVFGSWHSFQFRCTEQALQKTRQTS